VRTGYINYIVVLSDGSFVSCGIGPIVKRWSISTTNDIDNTITLEHIGTFRGHTAFVLYVVESNDNTLITSACDHTLKEWDIRTYQCLRTIQTEIDAWIMVITKDKSKLLCGLRTGNIEIWRTDDLVLVSTFSIHRGHTVSCFCELEDGSFVTSAAEMMERWNENGRVLQTFSGHRNGINRVIELNRDVIVSAAGNELKMWNVSTGECLRILLQHHREVIASRLMKLSRNKFVSWGSDGSLRVWSNEGYLIETIPTGETITAIARVGNHIVTTRYPVSGFSIRRLR